jgi:hypothetical protein
MCRNLSARANCCQKFGITCNKSPRAARVYTVMRHVGRQRMLRRLRHREKLLPGSHRGEELAACFVVSRECSAFGATVTDGTDCSSGGTLILDYQVLVPAWRERAKDNEQDLRYR